LALTVADAGGTRRRVLTTLRNGKGRRLQRGPGDGRSRRIEGAIGMPMPPPIYASNWDDATQRTELPVIPAPRAARNVQSRSGFRSGRYGLDVTRRG